MTIEIKNQVQINISKIDAAKRQLETAILLYFRNSDPVSVHTLAAAAYDILHGLCKTRDIKPFVKGQAVDMIREEKKKEYINKINEAQNFFKHGNQDSEKSYEFRPVTTDFLIWDACQMYQKITTEFTKLNFIFSSWFFLQNPEIINNDQAKGLFNDLANTSPDVKNRFIFFQTASSAYDKI